MFSICIFLTTTDYKGTSAYIWSHLIWGKTVFSEDYKEKQYLVKTTNNVMQFHPATVPSSYTQTLPIASVSQIPLMLPRYEALRVVLLKIQVTLCLWCAVPDVRKTMVPSPLRVNLLGMLINEEDETTFLQNAEHQPPNTNHSSQDLNPHPVYSFLSVASQVSTGKTTILYSFFNVLIKTTEGQNQNMRFSLQSCTIKQQF